ncbi:MAG: hypothetical protein ACRD03_10085, partial [Acidimicrobiales bacterium]
GTGVAVAGVGLGGHTGVPNQVGNFTVSVPAGAAVRQVLLYWEGHFREGTTPDDTVTLNGNPVTGSQIGGPTLFFGDVYATGFRADVTGLGLVGAGDTALTVSGLDNSFANDGAGVFVIYDEGTTPATIDVRDGVDLAFAGFAPPLDTTVPQTFTFPAAATDRTASLGVMAASVEPNRPNAIVITTGGVTTTLTNPLFSEQGADFDAKSIPVTIPAGATSLTVQAQSVGDGSGASPASLSWIVGSLSVPNPPPGAGAGTPGYWKNHPEAWPVDSLVLGGVTYTKDAAIAILDTPKSRDMTYALASQLIATKLNLLIGTDPSCITGTVAAADAWLATYPIGSGVPAGSDAWRVGEPLKTTLDAYNNGLLCAPSRD